jgi:hypothetical protein
MSLRVYVASPFSLGTEVLRVHDVLRNMRVEATSTWAYVAAAQRGNEDLHLRTEEEIRVIAEANDRAVLASDVVLSIVVPGKGREQYAECALARLNGIPVLWHGESSAFPLSAYRVGAERFVSLDDAFDRIAAMATSRLLGAA